MNIFCQQRFVVNIEHAHAVITRKSESSVIFNFYWSLANKGSYIFSLGSSANNALD